MNNIKENIRLKVGKMTSVNLLEIHKKLPKPLSKKVNLWETRVISSLKLKANLDAVRIAKQAAFFSFYISQITNLSINKENGVEKYIQTLTKIILTQKK